MKCKNCGHEISVCELWDDEEFFKEMMECPARLKAYRIYKVDSELFQQFHKQRE